jgi:hypothetical protein
MKIRFILLTILLCLLSHPSQSWSQVQQQPIKYFGYVGPNNDSDLSRVKSYTNFSSIVGVYSESLVPQITAVKNSGLKAVIDLGQVLWCPDDPNNPSTTWHLCRDPYLEGTYTNRWEYWLRYNYAYLNSNNVLAFTVMTEETMRGISVYDLQTAAALVKQTFPTIPVMVVDSSDDINRAGSAYQVPNNVDWIGLFKYYTHPNSDASFANSVSILKSKKQSWQNMAYILDGFYRSPHTSVAPTVADMDIISQEWYSVASQDPEAILLGVFLWPDLPSEGAIGSTSFPQSVLDKHSAIGRSILNGKPPAYQGSIEAGTCSMISGWAWDQNQPNTPVSIDVLDVTYGSPVYITTARANIYRPDLGIGNGVHGFSYTVDSNLRVGAPRTLRLRFSGTNSLLNGAVTLNNCVGMYWIKPSAISWGPPDTLTAAGFAQNGYGGVTLHWRDGTLNSAWNTVPFQPEPNPSNGVWSNTIPSRDYCHTFEAYATYAGSQSTTIVYNGVATGDCNLRVTWIQPQSTAGFGPAGSLVVAGSARGGPGGSQVSTWWRDVTAGTGWNLMGFAPVPDSNGIWYNAILNADYTHQYSVYIAYDNISSIACTYAGNGSITWCP